MALTVNDRKDSVSPDVPVSREEVDPTTAKGTRCGEMATWDHSPLTTEAQDATDVVESSRAFAVEPEPARFVLWLKK